MHFRRVEQLRARVEERSQSIQHQKFDFARGQSESAAAFDIVTFQKCRRDVISVALATLVRMGRCEWLACGIKYQAGEQARAFGTCSDVSFVPIVGQLGLHSLPKCIVNDALMLTSVDMAAMRNLSPIQLVLA